MRCELLNHTYITMQAAAPTKALATPPTTLPNVVTATSFTMLFKNAASFVAADKPFGA
jgi:hypothetical protein